MKKNTQLPFNPEDVEEIIAILDATSYQRLELSTSRFTLKIAREEGGGWTQEWQTTAVTDAEAVKTDQTAVGESTDTNTAAAAAVDTEGLFLIHAPLPGTFYRAPKPGAAPFVEVGDQVEPDSIVAIVETMKVMNSITAGTTGEVVAILPQNGELLHANTVLMHIRPDKPDNP